MSQENKQTSVVKNNVSIFTALAIFVNHAPRLIDDILNAAEAHNLSLTEEIATRLSLYSNNAQMIGFTKNIHNLIIAAREQKPSVVRSEAAKLRETFRQMIKGVGITAME